MISHALPARDLSQGEPHTVTSLDGSITLFIDKEAFDFHLDVQHEHDPAWRNAFLDQALWWGLEPIPYHECEPEDIEGGTRTYLVPVIPVSNVVGANDLLPAQQRSPYQLQDLGFVA